MVLFVHKNENVNLKKSTNLCTEILLILLLKRFQGGGGHITIPASPRQVFTGCIHK